MLIYSADELFNKAFTPLRLAECVLPAGNLIMSTAVPTYIYFLQLFKSSSHHIYGHHKLE